MIELDRDRWKRVRRVVEELIELPKPERERRLAGLEPELAAEARSLLSVDEGGSGDAFEAAVAAQAAAVLAGFSAPARGEETTLAEPGARRHAGDDLDPGPVAGMRVGPWRLERMLGRGGMAEVWEARRADGQFEHTVALKLLKRGMDSDEIVRRFLRERQILARLEHPGIARLFDGGMAPDGRPYFVLERVEGEPITRWCAGRGLDLRSRLRLVIACCEAVSAAHRRLVVHRDLKPSNILVTPEGQVKLLDFGIAKLLADEGGGHPTQAESRILTPAYAAPEQVAGEPVSTATDVYTLGVLAYELLTGRLPHHRSGRGMAELASAKLSEEIARPSTAVLMGAKEAATEGAAEGDTTTTVEPREQRRLARSLAGDLDTIVMTALRREPERRYPSAAALADDLGRFLDGRPIQARPDSLGYRARRFLGRHRFGVLAATVAALSLVTGLLVALWQAQRAEAAAAAARAEAETSRAIATFLTDVFTAADPEGKAAADLTARELVARGAERIDGELADQPRTRAAMQHVLGTVQYRLGEYAAARELLRSALAERRALRPPAPAEVAESAAVLGVVLHRQGESAEGVRLLEEARAFHEAAGPAAVPDLARDLNNLANAYKALDRNAEARAAFERAIALLASGHPEITPDQLPRTLNNYGLFLDRLREHAGARVALERALALHERNGGPDSALVAATLGNLSDLYVRIGELDRARAAAERALAIATRRYGPQHYDTGLALNSVGWTLLKSDRPAEAVPYFERSIAVFGPAVGEEHRATAYAQRNLGSALVEVGRREEGIAALRRAEAAFAAAVGPESHEVATVLVELGPALAATGEPAAGERQVMRAIELWRKSGTPASLRAVGGGWSALARLRLESCDAAGARAALGEAEREASAYPDAEWARSLPELHAGVAAPPPRCARADGRADRPSGGNIPYPAP